MGNTHINPYRENKEKLLDLVIDLCNDYLKSPKKGCLKHGLAPIAAEQFEEQALLWYISSTAVLYLLISGPMCSPDTRVILISNDGD